MLERGITCTRWHDYVDIVALARAGNNSAELLGAARAVARHRGVNLEDVGPHLAGYSAVAQAKWAAWRRKEHLETACEEILDNQLALVAALPHASTPSSFSALTSQRLAIDEKEPTHDQSA
ncbi:hypothetical protein [Mycobacterium sp. GA-1841]|uniref:hypothetical protein n=1 Tax=Mycobacterium sp. GA-1841 TaxID=1834154 RepID=UPI0020C94CB8|nr:hypothetical protein [Mycobacterium sp. GA-1841]